MNKISLNEAMNWMARLAATDGVITPTERKILSDFATHYNLNVNKIIRMAYGFAKAVDFPEVESISRSELKGKMFEKFIVSLLPPECSLMAWRSDKIVGNTYAAENLYPDLQIRHRLDDTEVEYFVECKYRSSWGDEGIDLSEHFNRYHTHANEQGLQLFFALGVGGQPSNPDQLYIIPAQMIKIHNKITAGDFGNCLIDKTCTHYHQYIVRQFSH